MHLACEKTSDLVHGKEMGAVGIVWQCTIAMENKRFHVKSVWIHHVIKENAESLGMQNRERFAISLKRFEIDDDLQSPNR